jgi:hypothetical protein
MEMSVKYVDGRPCSSEYGGVRTSRTAHGVTAVNACMLPPLRGNSTDASRGAHSTSSAATTLARPPASSSSPPRPRAVRRMRNKISEHIACVAA